MGRIGCSTEIELNICLSRLSTEIIYLSETSRYLYSFLRFVKRLNTLLQNDNCEQFFLKFDMLNVIFSFLAVEIKN